MITQHEISQLWERDFSVGGPMVSDTPLSIVTRVLSIDSHLRFPRIILNIGVGFGHAVRQISQSGHTVDCLDITSLALDRVAGRIRRGYLVGDELPKGEYDVIISLLVSQHLRDIDLYSQLSKAIPALSPSGVFALQFAGPPTFPFRYTSDTPDPEITLKQIEGGLVLRSPDRVRSMISELGGVVVFQDEVYDGWDMQMYPFHWQVLHISRKPRKTWT